MIVFFVFAGAFALGDWFAVAHDQRRIEYVFKPAVVVALTGAAISLDPASDLQRALFVAALVLSLAGDVFLMLPADLFAAGLAAFLIAHLVYIAGFATEGVSLETAAISALALSALSVPIGAWILRAVRKSSPRLAVPIAAYMLVIAAMAAAALATEDIRAGVGALLFYTSDALIAVNRFVVALRWAPPAVMVTYHLAQAALVVSLLD